MRLESLFSEYREDVKKIIGMQLETSEMIKELINTLPMKFIKIQSYDEQADFKEHIMQIKESKKTNDQSHLIDLLTLHVKNLPKITYEKVLKGFSDAMVSNEGDDYDIAERDIAMEEDQQILAAELDDLDDFLLMD